MVLPQMIKKNPLHNKKAFIFDEIDEEEQVHYWHYGEDTFALIEKM